jgi:hypothetical protein
MNLRKVHAWLAVTWVGAILVQVFLAGQAIANLGGSGDFSTHMAFGDVIGLIPLVNLVLAFPARLSSRDRWLSAAVLGLFVVQAFLPSMHEISPLFGALHPVNALLLFGLSAWYARHAWRAAATTQSAPSMAEAAGKAG